MHTAMNGKFASLFAVIAYAVALSTPKCHAFARTPRCFSALYHQHYATTNNDMITLQLFRDLVPDEEEDFRADITPIKKAAGLESFLKEDDRLCVIK